MGKQVRFYMLPEDERLFLHFVCQKPSVALLSSISTKPKLQVIEDPLNSLQPTTELRTILLWNTMWPIRKDDIQKIFLKEYDIEQGRYVATGEMVYSVNTSKAPVIEFSPSFIRHDGRLVQGRIWAEMYRPEPGQLIHKGANFESWYDQIARWLRRNFKRSRDIDGYFGPEALEWYQKGGKLASR